MTVNKINLTVKDILKRPLFKNTYVISGHTGLSRTVVWAHVLELFEGHSFINGGELILSTASGYSSNKKERTTFLSEIIKRNAAGLCIEIGTAISEIPKDMKELSNEYDFPIIIFKTPVHFVDITMDLHRTIMHHHTQQMYEFEKYSFKIQQLALENRGIFNITQSFYHFTNMQTFFVDLNGSSMFAPRVSKNYQKEFIHFFNIHNTNNNNYQTNEPQSFIFQNKEVLFQPIVAKGNTLSFTGVILDYDANTNRFLHLALNYTAMSMAQILLREMFAEERFLNDQQKLLSNIIERKTENEEEIKQLLGIKTDKRNSSPMYCTILIQIKKKRESNQKYIDSSFYDLIGIFRKTLDYHSWDIYILFKGYRIYFLLIKTKNIKDGAVQQERNKAVSSLETICANSRLSNFDIQIGAGRTSKTYSEIAYHFEEAEEAINSSPQSRTVYFENLGVQRLFLQNNSFAMQSFVNDYIGSLIEHDINSNTQLLLTLKAFIDSKTKQEAAARLYVKRQTLYQRLNKIKQILNTKELNSEYLSTLGLAIQAYEWINNFSVEQLSD